MDADHTLCTQRSPKEKKLMMVEDVYGALNTHQLCLHHGFSAICWVALACVKFVKAFFQLSRKFGQTATQILYGTLISPRCWSRWSLCSCESSRIVFLWFFMACFICFVQFLPQIASPGASWFGRLAKAAHGCGPVAWTCLGPAHHYPNDIQAPFKKWFIHLAHFWPFFTKLLSSFSDARDKYHLSTRITSPASQIFVECSSLCKILWELLIRVSEELKCQCLSWATFWWTWWNSFEFLFLFWGGVVFSGTRNLYG